MKKEWNFIGRMKSLENKEVKMYSEIEWKFARKVLLMLKEYKENPKKKPDVRDSIDFNIALMLDKTIPIQDIGKY